MFGSRPHVSIAVSAPGLCQTLRPTLDALLQQPDRDLEVLVYNPTIEPAGTSIGRDYAARDARVRCLPAVAEPSPAIHLARALEEARGDYFMLNPADEHCDPGRVARCAAALDADPSLVLVYESEPPAQAAPARAGDAHPQPLAHHSAWRRLARLLFSRRLIGGARFHGLMRLDWMRHARLSTDADIDRRVLLARLALCGRIGAIAPIAAPAPADALPGCHELTSPPDTMLSHARALLGYFNAVRQTWMAPIGKAMCYLVVAAFAVVMLPMLVIELLAAMVRAAGRPLVLLWPADMEWSPRRPDRRSQTPVDAGLAPDRRSSLRSIPDRLKALEASVAESSRVA